MLSLTLKNKIEKWFPTRNKRRNGVILDEKLPLNQKLDCACLRLGIEKKMNGMDSDLMSIREITYPQIQTKYSRP